MSTLGQGMKEQAQTDARREIRLSQKLGAADQAGEESVGGSRARTKRDLSVFFYIYGYCPPLPGVWRQPAGKKRGLG